MKECLYFRKPPVVLCPYCSKRMICAVCQGMDLAVSLQLFKSRYNELQSSLDVPRQKLLSSMEATSEYCQAALESHTYMNKILRKIQASKAKAADTQVDTECVRAGHCGIAHGQ